MSWLLVPAGVALLGAFTRFRTRRDVEAEYSRRFGMSENKIARGAEAFTFGGTNGRALLLIHGSGDSPQSMRYLGERLRDAGYTVRAPLLPGHGRSPREFARATALDYHEAIRSELAGLGATSSWVGLVGLSMGGALAVRAATETSDIKALVLLAPYLTPPPVVRWTSRLGLAWSWAVPYLRGQGENSVHDVTARDASRAYGSFSRTALAALVATADFGRRALPRVSIPTLVINSEHDNRIPRTLAERALAEMPRGVEQHWVAGCGHVITVDYCKDTVATLVLDFLARHAG